MKISKLFHWLYAFLMFLPVTFLLPSLLYFGFNDNATAQEYTKEEPVYYQSNNVTSIDDLVVGNIYEFNFDNTTDTLMDNVTLCDTFIVVEGSYTGDGYEGNPQASMPYIQFSNNNYVYTYETIDNVVRTRYWSFVKLYFVYKQTNNNNFPIGLVTETDYKLIKEYQEVTYTMGITESVNQSILDTFDLPMFSWTSDNFIIAPFNYITNLFGLPDGNVVNKYLDYWLSISIIYLCFDVIMYVPLLVHRWLDKGIVE